MRRPKRIYLSENLQKLSVEKKVAISTIANTLSINKSTLSNWYNGTPPKNLLALIRLADYFEVSLNDLIFGIIEETVLHQARFEDLELIVKKIQSKGSL